MALVLYEYLMQPIYDFKQGMDDLMAELEDLKEEVRAIASRPSTPSQSISIETVIVNPPTTSASGMADLQIDRSFRTPPEGNGQSS